jgi:RNA polymerase sigma-70 factor (ECF subfamily)
VEDAVSETFLVVWRKSDRIPPGDQALPWLYGVAYRVLTNQWRSAHRRGRLAGKVASLGIGASSLPEDVLILDQEHRQALAAVSALRASEREILRLAFWEELSQADIAVALGITIAAVRQRLYQAKKRLTDEYIRLENRGIRAPSAQKGDAW